MRHTHRQTATRTLADFYRAADQRRAVTITYLKPDGTETVRTLEIQDIRTTSTGRIVIRALDRETGDGRTFRLDRIGAYTVSRSGYTLDHTEATPRASRSTIVRSTSQLVALELGRDYWTQTTHSLAA